MAHSFLVSELADPVIELASDHSGNPVSQPVEQTARDWKDKLAAKPASAPYLRPRRSCSLVWCCRAEEASNRCGLGVNGG
jgi:hypothetical protein